MLTKEMVDALLEPFMSRMADLENVEPGERQLRRIQNLEKSVADLLYLLRANAADED